MKRYNWVTFLFHDFSLSNISVILVAVKCPFGTEYPIAPPLWSRRVFHLTALALYSVHGFRKYCWVTGTFHKACHTHALTPNSLVQNHLRYAKPHLAVNARGYFLTPPG